MPQQHVHASMGMQGRIFGAIVMMRSGIPLWSGWLSKPQKLIPTKQLCKTIADVFTVQSNEDSSYLDAGTFAAASTADPAFIVSIICTLGTPETEVRCGPLPPCPCPTCADTNSHDMLCTVSNVPLHTHARHPTQHTNSTHTGASQGQGVSPCSITAVWTPAFRAEPDAGDRGSLSPVWINPAADDDGEGSLYGEGAC